MSLKDWKLLSNICIGIIILEFVYLFMFTENDFVFDGELLRWLVPLNFFLLNPMLVEDIKNRNSKNRIERESSTPTRALFLLIVVDIVALMFLFGDLL